ncbi:hypothetical protein, conserved [Trypanosoma brucei gambiense DAL972]|uniref:Uncharacterized protein n=1 Tax=Trypanosoma brucei gambiense (strain MHOM/CI/86/DAL972) TaxID=679716 RepID=C9ZSW2_TRYB9|nr:hypothetical protein, conserved [Trypanosoma brucei gambiense DAL972]CBH12497.1 hypothetical protein, conserved [Trypanosoma brucei gambiense DAL972]|eukprot:XP_011774777.1 hypothetical protein, conserved [Trypanosoma brucei gambiense DAL972]
MKATEEEAKNGMFYGTAALGGSGTQYSERAQRIRRQEMFFRHLRRLVVPAFAGYGLYVTRPHEGHFIRYLVDRSRHEAFFNEIHSVVAADDGDKPVVANAAAGDGSVASVWARWLPLNSGASGRNGASDANEEDAIRIANRRKLFSSTGASASRGAEGTSPCGWKSLPQRHELSEKLWELRNNTKRHDASVTSDTSGSGEKLLPVRLEFDDWLFFATGALIFTDPLGAVVRRHRFFGICGSLWWEL